MSNIEEKKSLTENNLSVRAGILLMIAVAVARGSSFLFSKQLLTHIEPLNLLGIRSITAFAVLMLLFGERVVTACRENKQNIIAGALIGAVYFVVMALELNGLQYTTTSTASFIENSAIVWVPIYESILLKRMPARKTLLCAAVCLAGVGFVAAGGFSSGIGVGEILCFLCALVYASAIVLTDREAKKQDPFVVGILYVGFMGLFGLAGSLITETTQLLHSASDWAMLLMLAIVCSAFGFALQPVAQRVISSETTGLLTAVNPLTTAVLGTIFLHEPFGPARLIGAILILIGIIMHSYISSNPN